MASFQAWKRSQLQDNQKVFEGHQHEVIRDIISEDVRKDQSVHIFVCTDEADLRPLAVLINSSMANAL